MKSRELLESIANEIVAKFNLDDAMSHESDPGEEDGKITISVDVNLDPFLENIQSTVTKHDLNREDSVTVLALCLHKALEMPMDEALETASAVIKGD